MPRNFEKIKSSIQEFYRKENLKILENYFTKNEDMEFFKNALRTYAKVEIIASEAIEIT